MRKNDALYNQIKGGIYHSTSITGFRGICSSGSILPNTGSFPFSFPQSPHNCCHKLGAISLLDLRSPAHPLVGPDAWLNNWERFLNNHKPITVLLDIAPDYLSEQLHDYESLRQRFPGCGMVIEAEKCYPRPIPIDAVSRCILVCAKRHTFFDIISVHELTNTYFFRTEASFEARLRKSGWKEPNPDPVILDCCSAFQQASPTQLRLT